MVTRFVVNFYILPIDVNAVARQNVVITTFCNVTTFWVATTRYPLRHEIRSEDKQSKVLNDIHNNIDIL